MARSPPAGFADRLRRATTDPLQLDSWSLPSRVFEVRSATTVYRVTFTSSRAQCSCQDFAHRHAACKHVLFVLTRVLGVAADDPILWQHPLLPLDLQAIFDRAPPRLFPGADSAAAPVCPTRLSAAMDGAWEARANHGQFSLSKTLGERAEGSFVVSIDHRGASGRVSKCFTWFDSAEAFFAQTARMPAADRHFHEVIEPGVWTKLYFDVEHYVATAEDPSRINECLFVLKQALLRTFPQIADKIYALDDVILLSASRAVGPPPGAFKHSYHVIFPRIRFMGTARMKEFAKSVHRDLRLQARDRKGGVRSMLDVRVYNITQSFRLIESCKIEDPGFTAVPLAYADKRSPVSLRDLLRTVLTYDGDGEDCVRVDTDKPHTAPAVARDTAWPNGVTRYFDRDETSAFAWMEFNFGADGSERLRVAREYFARDGYVHFLSVQWRSQSKRYLYAFRGDMEAKARELHAVLCGARGSEVKEFGLGAKVNNHGPGSWVVAGWMVSDGRLGYLTDEESDGLVPGVEDTGVPRVVWHTNIDELEAVVAHNQAARVLVDEEDSGDIVLGARSHTNIEELESVVVDDQVVAGGEVTSPARVVDDEEDPDDFVLWTRWHTNRPGAAAAAGASLGTAMSTPKTKLPVPRDEGRSPCAGMDQDDPGDSVLLTMSHANRQGDDAGASLGAAKSTPQKLPVPRDEGRWPSPSAEPKRRRLAFDTPSPLVEEPAPRQHVPLAEWMKRQGCFPLDANGVPVDLGE